MKKALLTTLFLALNFSSSIFGVVEDSVIPQLDAVYGFNFGKKINSKQKEAIDFAIKNQSQKLRVMTYNMLYNDVVAEHKLPEKHRWAQRKARLLEYLSFANADLIGSQELQEDQINEIMESLGNKYKYYGLKTRLNEGRTDINAVFYNPQRLELLDSKTVTYQNETENAFTFCYFRDKLLDQRFVVLNTKLSWGDVEKRLAEALQLSLFAKNLAANEPIILFGDFNTFPFLEYKRNIFLDGGYIQDVLTTYNLKDALKKSTLGHSGPLCSITNSKTTLMPFSGAELDGFILDHIYVNDQVKVFTHGIDTAKVDGEYPSDHFPVISDLFLK